MQRSLPALRPRSHSDGNAAHGSAGKTKLIIDSDKQKGSAEKQKEDTAPEVSTQPYEFVNLTGSHTLDPSVVSDVRKHAQARSAIPQPNPPNHCSAGPMNGAQSAEVLRFRLGPQGMRLTNPKRKKSSHRAGSGTVSPVKHLSSSGLEHSEMPVVSSLVRLDFLIRQRMRI